MENLYEVAFQALNRYFTVLEKTGYIKEKDVNKLLLLTFIIEFLQEYSGYITEEDYNLISRIISCMAGSSCLVPYVQYQQLSIPQESYISDLVVRLSEYNNIRHAESSTSLRLVNQ